MLSFKEQVIRNLSPGQELVRIYAKSQLKSAVEIRYDGRLVTHSLQKLDIGSLFSKPPVFEIEGQGSYDDLYRMLSDRYGLGLVSGIDYYHGQPIYPSEHLQYALLPIMSDSYGYYGETPVYFIKRGCSVNGEGYERDLTSLDQEYLFRAIKVKSFFTSTVFSVESKLFVDNRLTQTGIEEIVKQASTHFDDKLISLIHQQLTGGTVTGLLSDGLSDVMIFLCPNGLEFLIRFSSFEGDLPDLNFISQSSSNILSDDPQGLLLGEMEKVSENPGEREREIYISDYEVIQHNSSLSLQEEETQEEKKPEKQLTIDEVEEEIVVYLDPERM